MKKWAGALLITKDNEVILQRRDTNPGIVNPGKTTLFGGSVIDGENPEDCLKREMMEELGLDIKDYKFFGRYEKRQATYGEDCDCYVYLVPRVDIKGIQVSEGRGYKLVSSRDNYFTSEFSLITQEVLKDYFN